MNPFGFNTPESPTDYRDIKLEDVTTAGPIPEKYFVDISMLPVTMQYKRGSCVAHATAKRKERVEFTDVGHWGAFSPRFLYSIIKKDDENTSEGSAIRNGLKMIYHEGICTEATYPSDYPEMSHAEFMDYSKIPQKAFDEAKAFKDSSYASVKIDKDSIKQAIMTADGVIGRVVIDDQWWTPSWQEKDILPLHAPKTQALGGHAIYIYGFDGDRFYFRNSWSTAWGKDGDGYFDWDTYHSALTEVWTSVDIDNDKLKEVHDLPINKPLTMYMFYGVMGDDVKRLQKVLNVLPNSGWFGPKTRAAVIAYQGKNGIEKTGTVGPITRAKLNAEFFS